MKRTWAMVLVASMALVGCGGEEASRTTTTTTIATTTSTTTPKTVIPKTLDELGKRMTARRDRIFCPGDYATGDGEEACFDIGPDAKPRNNWVAMVLFNSDGSMQIRTMTMYDDFDRGQEDLLAPFADEFNWPSGTVARMMGTKAIDGMQRDGNVSWTYEKGMKIVGGISTEGLVIVMSE